MNSYEVAGRVVCGVCNKTICSVRTSNSKVTIHTKTKTPCTVIFENPVLRIRIKGFKTLKIYVESYGFAMGREVDANDVMLMMVDMMSALNSSDVKTEVNEVLKTYLT